MGTRLRVESRSAAFIGMTNSAMVVTRPAHQLGYHYAPDSKAMQTGPLSTHRRNVLAC
jgi:hypothetical protein